MLSHLIHHSISKALVASYQKYVDGTSKNESKGIAIQNYQTLLVAATTLTPIPITESQKFEGPSAHAGYQKPYQEVHLKDQRSLL